MINSHLPSPILAGLIRPALYIPGTDYTEQEIKMIYHHELSHYHNKDLWYKLFLLIINSVYLFNSALYLMRKEADKDIEYICDSNVIKICAGEERGLFDLSQYGEIQNYNGINGLSFIVGLPFAG